MEAKGKHPKKKTGHIFNCVLCRLQYSLAVCVKRYYLMPNDNEGLEWSLHFQTRYMAKLVGETLGP